MTLTLKLPDGLKAWLAAEGDPLYRSATEQAAYLCAQYLKAAYQRAQGVTPQRPRSVPDRAAERSTIEAQG